LRGSTVSNNEAGASGGGMFYQSGSNVSFNNDTFSGNSAATGGGIALGFVGNVEFRNATITNNTSSGQGAGIYFPNSTSDPINIPNSILADNSSDTAVSSQDCFVEQSANVTFTSLGFNIFGDVSDCALSGTGDSTGVNDPGLGPLADNGGPTFTHLLLGGSPAFNHGDPNGCKDSEDVLFTEDQRGETRPQNGRGDSGSVETASPSLQVDRQSINFGDIALGVPNARSFTVSNTGDRDLNVTGMTLSNTLHFAVDPGDCVGLTFTLGAGESCSPQVIFMPQAEGPFTATLTLESNDPENPSIEIDLTGTGVQAPGGGICGDTVCSVGEDCSCSDCQNLPSCQPGGGGTCGDGICAVMEDCSCEDCEVEATCQTGGGGECGDGICAVDEDCTCSDCSGESSCQIGGGGFCGDGIC